mgnify:CR=1 FL=1
MWRYVWIANRQAIWITATAAMIHARARVFAVIVFAIIYGCVNCRDAVFRTMLNARMTGLSNTSPGWCSPARFEHSYLTHSHFDHFGSAAALQECTGARIAIHCNDAAPLAEAGTPHIQRSYAQDWEALYQSVRRLRECRPYCLYCGHGGAPVSSSELQDIL